MSQKTKQNVKKGVINTFASFGYVSCFLQGLWAAILYLGTIQSLALFIPRSIDKQVEQPPGFTFTLPDPLGAIILGAVVVIMIIITIYALISIPRSIVRTSNKIVHNTAEGLAPLVIKAQHKQETKRLRITITARLALIIKMLLIVTPIPLAAVSGLLEKQSIDYTIAMIVAYGLACLSVMFFVIQYALAKLLRIKIADLW